MTHYDENATEVKHNIACELDSPILDSILNNILSCSPPAAPANLPVADGEFGKDFAHPISIDGKVNIKAVAEEALDYAEELLSAWLPDGERKGNEYVAFSPVNPDQKTGSLSINIETGKWSDFSTNEKGSGGGDLVALKAFLDRCTMREAALKVKNEIAFLKNGLHRQGKTPDEVAKEREKRAQKEKEKQRSAIFRWNTSFKLNEAHPYFKKRGITHHEPEQIRFTPLEYLPNKQSLPAILLAVRSRPGEDVEAIHRIFLDQTGSFKADIDNPKKALGPISGKAIWFGDVEETLVICEGPEDALTLRMAGAPFVACAISGSNLGKLEIPHGVKRVIIFQDNDDAGIKAAAKAAQHYSAKGFATFIAKAPDGIKDANDLLQEKGIDAIKAALDSASAVEVKEQPSSVETTAKDRKRNGSARNKTQVEDDFLRTDKGIILAKHPHNIEVALKKLGLSLAFDLLKRNIVIQQSGEEPQQFEDIDSVNIRMKIIEQFGFDPGKEFLFDALRAIADKNRFHPVHDYLKSLKWDGIKRIETFFIDHCGAENTPYVRAVSRIFFVAASKRVFEPGCEYQEIPVLETFDDDGKTQGKGKSSLLQALAVKPEWFSDCLDLGAEPRVVIEQAHSHWIIELSELAGIRGSESEKVKAFLSRSSDKAALKYEKIATERPRAFVMYGTTNDQTYLKDTTGNRRFWPLRLKRIPESARTPEIIDQLHAEAYYCYLQGESIRLPSSLYEAAHKEQEKRTTQDAYIDQLEFWFGEEKGHIPTAVLYKALGIGLGKAKSYEHSSVAQSMEKLGFIKKLYRLPTHGSKPTKCFVRGKSDKVKTPLKLPSDVPGHDWEIGPTYQEKGPSSI